MSLPRLDRPPIVEVACGIVFDSVNGLDPVRIGEYRHHRGAFPRHEIHPALTDEGEIFFGAAPQRVWLISDDGSLVLQIQHDRFFLNWRWRDNEYPRFNDTESTHGLLSRTLQEFERFEDFVRTAIGATLDIRRVELSKVDHLAEGVHWEDRSDLVRVLPVLGAVFAIGGHDEQQGVLLQLVTPKNPGTMLTSIATQARPRPDGGRIRVVVLDSRCVRPIQANETTRQAFMACNDELNDVFARLIPQAEFGRFMKGDNDGHLK